jgi:hypothetical protein
MGLDFLKGFGKKMTFIKYGSLVLIQYNDKIFPIVFIKVTICFKLLQPIYKNLNSEQSYVRTSK